MSNLKRTIPKEHPLEAKFLLENADLTKFANPTGTLVTVRLLHGHLKVVIEVGDWGTYEELRNAIPVALAWRDRLHEWEGNTVHGLRKVFLRAQRHGKSNAELAEQINTIVAMLLQRGVKESQLRADQPETAAALMTLHTEMARGILRQVGMQKDKMEEALTEGIAAIRDGQLPFAKDYPVSKANLTKQMQLWRKKRREKSS